MPLLLYFGIILSSVTQSASTKLFHRGQGSVWVFNAIKAVAAFLFMLAFGIGQMSFHLPTVLFGISYGFLLSVSMYAGFEALRRGPMALTSMLVTFSVFIPFLWGICVNGETLNLCQGIAIFLFVSALLAINADKLKRTGEKHTSYGIWLFFVALTFFANGIGSVLQTEHQTLFRGEYQSELTLYTMGFCALVYIVIFFVKEPLTAIVTTKKKAVALLSGVANALVTFLTVMLAATENASVLFPIISAGSALGVLLCGRFLFHERLKVNHYLALVLGVTAVVLLKI